MSRDSQASFSQSARNAIREKYLLRCVICLNHISTAQCAHIIDAATLGLAQLKNAVELGILPQDYQRNSAGNGLLQCPTCHSYFTQNFLALSLPIPVLEYVRDYLRDTPKATRKPLREVFDLLVEALQGTAVDLPDAGNIFPYLGLFTLVTLSPTRVIGDGLSTLFLPPLSVIRGNKFVKAPPNASPTSENVARIFESLALVDNSPRNPGAIPISPDDQEFKETRYWRIPVPLAPIFAALIARLSFDTSGCQDVKLAKAIYYILGFQSLDENVPDENDGNGGPSGGSGPDDDNEGGGGPSGGGRASSKRKAAGGQSGAPRRKVTKKPRKMTSGSRTRACGESGEFPPRARYQNQQSDRCEIASSMYTPDDDVPAHLISTGWDDDSDSENGRSVSATSPHDEDNPAEWQFGPSFSTNKIVFTARGINLT